MITSFNEQLWIDFDLEIEFFLRYIVGWIGYNAAKDNPDQRNFHEGQYWSYNSYPEYSKLLPGFSSKQIRTITARAIKHGLLVIGHFNKKKYDNTNWYTLTAKGWTYFEREAKKLYPHWFAASDNTVSTLHTPAQMGRPPAQTGRPIPKELNSLSSNNTITTSESSDSASAARKAKKDKIIMLMWQMIAVYREVFPNNPQPHPRAIATSLQKTLQTLIKRWHELDPGGKEFDIQAFTRYMNALKTLAPKFSLGEYETQSGHKKKNNLETFARWNTLVKFLENQYS